MHAPALAPDAAAVTYLKVPEVAARLNLSKRHAYELIARGDLTGVRMGGAMRVRSDDLDAYERKIRAEAEGQQ
ncbi:MAG: helix-turn-helix domain-containing protein [Streptosporangiaceae bacterium]